MFSRILIANRGEIALRIIRACRELGVQSVAVFSKEDAKAHYLKYADDAICIGPAPAAESYLNIPRIISAAEIGDVEAIHPGYGFLAENAHFAEVCESCRISFIGPSAEVMRRLGNKNEAIKLAREAKVPVVPGSAGIVKDEKEASRVAQKIGFPVMIKAAAGGGGRGMRIAHNDISLANAFFAARSEAEAAFKNSELYLEKYIQPVRHIEVQILADEHGNIVHLGERDCSLQRRHQKLIEEAPSPAITFSLREELGKAAIRLASAAGYTNAGTIEFIVDKNNKFYFIEANTRIQVEHTVTEMVTGIDLIKEQLRISSGEKLRFKQRHIKLQGAAIECRINAEDADNGFKPCPGKITFYQCPGGGGVRVDSHVYSNYTVSPYYDSLISKLIVHRPSRAEAIVCMKRALDEYVIEGVKTTISFYKNIFANKHFLRGKVDTAFIEREYGG